jgi:phage shock protein E
MTAIRIRFTKPLIFVFAVSLQLIFSDVGLAGDISQRALIQRLDMHEAPLILDVRKPDEFASGHIPGAINIPHTEIDKHLNELRSNINKEVVVYCETGRRAGIAEGILEKAGFTKVLHLDGDMKEWRQRGLPMVSAESL